MSINQDLSTGLNQVINQAKITGNLSRPNRAALPLLTISKIWGSEFKSASLEVCMVFESLFQ